MLSADLVFVTFFPNIFLLGISVVICLEQLANDFHVVLLMPLPLHHFLLH